MKTNNETVMVDAGYRVTALKGDNYADILNTDCATMREAMALRTKLMWQNYRVSIHALRKRVIV